MKIKKEEGQVPTNEIRRGSSMETSIGILSIMGKQSTQKGQVIIILLLIIVVALAIGLALVGKSVTEISTSSKTENSSRAFSAAEAGLERALQEGMGVNFSVTTSPDVIAPEFLENQSKASLDLQFGLPRAGKALEYPPFGKESFAQFWLADPVETTGLFPKKYYDKNSFYLYFGDDKDYSENPSDQPAVEVHVVSKDKDSADKDRYSSKRFIFDSYKSIAGAPEDSARPINNCTTNCTYQAEAITNNNSTPTTFYYRVEVNGYPNTGNSYPVLVRIRFLYTNSVHPIAIAPINDSSSLPSQARIYTSTGTSGSVQRKLKIFQEAAVLPFFFDYVLFSAGELRK